MNEKQRNTLLASFALAELKSRFNVNAEDVIQNFDKEKATNHFNSMFPNKPSEEDLVKLAHTAYKRLKIK